MIVVKSQPPPFGQPSTIPLAVRYSISLEAGEPDIINVNRMAEVQYYRLKILWLMSSLLRHSLPFEDASKFTVTKNQPAHKYKTHTLVDSA